MNPKAFKGLIFLRILVLYLLTSSSKFVSIRVYVIAFALLVTPLPLVAASLHADAKDFGMGNYKLLLQSLH